MAYDVGTAVLHVVPSFRKVETELKRLAENLGKQMHSSVSDQTAKGVSDGLDSGVRQADAGAQDAGTKLGKKIADEATGAFGRTMRDGVERALRDISKIESQFRLSTDTEALQKVRRELAGIVDDPGFLGSDRAVAKVAELREELGRLSREAATLRDRVEADAALRNLDRAFQSFVTAAEAAAKEEERIRDEVHAEALRQEERHQADLQRLIAESRRKAEREAEREADQARRKAEQEFEQSLPGRIQKGFRDAFARIPKLRIDADSTPAEAALQDLRAKMERLSGTRIGVDIDAKTVQAAINYLRDRLQKLTDSRNAIEVRAEAAEAARELFALQKLLDSLAGRDIDITVDAKTDRARRDLSDLADIAEVDLGRLGALIVSVISLGPAVVPLAAAAAGAIGLIGTAAAAAAIGVGTLALGFSGIGEAVKALNDYQENAAKSAVAVSAAQLRVASAQDAVTSATRSLANARASAAEGVQQAAQRIADAERDVVRAREDAARSVQSATRRVADAERGLTRAQEDALEAREALNQAYLDAVDALADLDSAVKRNALDQREAALEIKEAQEELNKYLNNPRATEEEREQAQITYERRMLQIADLRREGERLAREQEKANQKGVEGSDEVVRARRRIADADAQLADAQQDLVDARAAAVRAQVDGAERIADAERRVADAQRQAAAQQRQAAHSVSQAQQGVISAQRQLRQATEAAGVAGGEAMDKLRKSMENLGPAGQEFARFLFSLKPELDRLRATAQENLLPGVQSSIERLLPHLPKLNEFVGKVAKSLGWMFDEASRIATTDPTWRRFFDHVGKNTVPTLERMFRISEDVARGLAGLFLALTGADPNDALGKGLEDMAQSFADWATTLDQNEGFQKFLDFVRQEGPVVVAALKEMAIFAGRFVVAAAPIGVLVLAAFTKLFELLNKIPIDTLTILIGIIGAVAAAIGILGAVTALATAGIAALVIIGIGVLAAGLVILHQKFGWFHDFVAAQVRAVGAVVSWVFNKVITPIFNGLVWLMTEVLGPTFRWLYSHVIKPVWGLIQVAFRVGWAVAQVVFGLFQIAIKSLGNGWSIFYNSFFKPIWDKVSGLLSKLGGLISTGVEPEWRKGVKALGAIWDGLMNVLKAPVRFFVETIVNDGVLRAYNWLADKFKVEPRNVKVELPKGFAVGGAVLGPGTATSDSILARLSNGEHVWTAREVQAAGGHRAVEAMRHSVLASAGPAYRDGGGVGDGLGDLYRSAKQKAGDALSGLKSLFTDPAGTLKKIAKELYATIPGKDSLLVKLMISSTNTVVDGLVNWVTSAFGGIDGGPTGGKGNVLGGSAGMMRILRSQFPGLRLISGYRPNSVTLSGKRSYHADDRAVDVAPLREVAQWISTVWRKGTKELITPFQEFNLLRGKPHRYTGAVWNQHNFAGGNAHVHWSYDQGGWLPPGVSTVVNNTGQPEAVLNPGQWRTLERNQHAERRMVQNVFQFRDTTLDPSWLRAHEARQNALARVGRPY